MRKFWTGTFLGQAINCWGKCAPNNNRKITSESVTFNITTNRNCISNTIMLEYRHGYTVNFKILFFRLLKQLFDQLLVQNIILKVCSLTRTNHKQLRTEIPTSGGPKTVFNGWTRCNLYFYWHSQVTCRFLMLNRYLSVKLPIRHLILRVFYFQHRFLN